MNIADHKVVAFIDMLGFASLTEDYPVNLDLLNAADRPLAIDLDIITKARENRLTDSFASFHSSLKWSLEIPRMRYPVTTISFSDSAFIVTSQLYQATRIVIDLLQSLVTHRVPVRAGIAYGSFAALRFRSDVTPCSGDHAAHFLGTGVVRAHGAEACGVKGMRILLHPSAMPLLADEAHNPTASLEDHVSCIELPEQERLNGVGVGHEVDYWSLKPTARAKAWHSLQDMWNQAPEGVRIHYQATAEAIDRMRIRQGDAPLENLRRRTLPQAW